MILTNKLSNVHYLYTIAQQVQNPYGYFPLGQLPTTQISTNKTSKPLIRTNTYTVGNCPDMVSNTV